MGKYIKYAAAIASILGLASIALAQTATSTPPTSTPAPHQLIKPEELNINPEGKFLAHGMVVQSVSGSSFVGKVWGTSWTVNITNVSELKFLLQNGAGASQTNLSSVMKPGDEVGVSGSVDSSQELTVNGQVVRDYSLGNAQELKDREVEIENEQGGSSESSTSSENSQNNQGQSENEGEHGNSGSSSDNQKAINDIQQQIQNILEQIKQMQGK